MRHWVQHKAIEDRPTSTRCAQLLALQRARVIDAISRTEEGEMGHSILERDMPDHEDHHCEPSKRMKLRYSPSDVNTGNRSVHSSDGSPRSMHPRSGSARPRNSTTLTLGQPPLPLPPLNKLRKIKMRESCRNSAASPRRSCAIGRSTRPSRTCRPAPHKCANACLAPGAGYRCHLPHRGGRHGPLNPTAGHARRRGLLLRANQEEETSILAIRCQHW